MTACRFLLPAFLGLTALTPISAQAETNVLFVVDASGSMKKKIGDEVRMDVAKRVLDETIKSMPGDARLGLMVYGHRKAKDCKDLELAVPIGGEDAASIASTVTKLEAKGETPIAEALTKAAKSFNAFKGQQNSIILVTDGVEECKGDPCAAAKALKDAGLGVTVNIVGFTLGSTESQSLQCVTEMTGGKYYAAADAKGLTEALKAVQTKVQETAIVQTAEAPKPSNDLLAADNGGTLVYAPNAMWENINKDHVKFQGPAYAGEGVWSFRDGKPGTFSQIELLIPQESPYNVKEFEVLAADKQEGPYKSLGKFTAQNVKMMPEGWQGFKFPETTARFVKVVYISPHSADGYVRGHAMRLIGKLDESAPAAEKPAAAQGVDILSEASGAKLEIAPSEVWTTLTKDYGNFKGPIYAGEGVWSFKDGKPASFDRIEMLITKQSPYNPKEFEVLVGDESPTGAFRSVGTFTAQNAKVQPEGWQSFTFPKVSARYLKVNFKNQFANDGYVAGAPIRVMGTIDEAAAPTAKPAEPAGTNILAQSAGGALLVGPKDEWKQLNDGQETRLALKPGTEGVWAFAGEKPATFEAVDILVPHKENYTIRSFEVLVGDEGPTGAFRSIGTFTPQNTRKMPDGYQRFTFPKVQAKYVKIKLLASYSADGYCAAHEFRVIGAVGQ